MAGPTCTDLRLVSHLACCQPITLTTFYRATDKVLSRHINLTLSEAVQHNASVYAHIQFQPETGAPAFTLTHRINMYRPRPKLNTKLNLVSGIVIGLEPFTPVRF